MIHQTIRYLHSILITLNTNLVQQPPITVLSMNRITRITQKKQKECSYVCMFWTMVTAHIGSTKWNSVLHSPLSPLGYLQILGCGGIKTWGTGDSLVVVWKIWIGVAFIENEVREPAFVERFWFSPIKHIWHCKQHCIF